MLVCNPVLFISGSYRNVSAKDLFMWKIFEVFCLTFSSQTCLFLSGNISISSCCICPRESVASLSHVKQSPVLSDKSSHQRFAENQPAILCSLSGHVSMQPRLLEAAP